MKTIGALCALGTVWLALGGTAWAQKGKPQPSTCGADIPLSVEILDAPGPAGDPLGYDEYRLVSDGGGPYVHGVGKVAAQFGVESCLFNLKLNLYTAARHVQLNLDPDQGIGPITTDFLNFSRIASVPITTDDDRMDAFCSGGVNESTFQTASPQDNYAGCGGEGDPDGRYVLRFAGGTIDEGSPHYKLRYNLDIHEGVSLDSYSPGHCNGSLAPMCQTSFVRVYHPDANTWIVTPHDQSALGGAALAAFLTVPRRGPMTFHHAESVPFRMVITRLP